MDGWGPFQLPSELTLLTKFLNSLHKPYECLKDTLKMHQKSTGTQLGTTVKSVLQQHREQQIKDVQQTIVQLSHLYARVLTLNPESDETELTRLRTELDESLTFAKQVDAKIRELTPPHDYDAPEIKNEE